jgi:hypothetical protein
MVHLVQQLDALYAFMKGDRDREEQVQSAISTQLGPTVAVYIRRALEQRKTADNPCKLPSQTAAIL